MAKPGRTGPKRTQAQKDADLEYIAKWRVRGKSLRDIADMLDEEREYPMSYPTVRKDAEGLTKHWREQAAEFTKAAKERTLVELEAVAGEAWLAWEKSKKDRLFNTLKKKGIVSDAKTEKENAAAMALAESTIRKEGQTGDPAYLTIILGCAEKRARLLGVEAPQKVQMTDQAGAPVPVGNLMPIINIIMPEGSFDPFNANISVTTTASPSGSTDNAGTASN